ncbi:MAG: restriction endonuclease [Afipia sp.]
MIEAKQVRYIKLGPKGRWAEAALSRNELHFGYGKVTHDLAVEANVAKIQAELVAQGRDVQAATRDAREVIDFYHLGADCLWITFARDHLWWTFAEPEVTWLTKDLAVTGERVRKAIGGWRNTDIHGAELRIDSLSTRLTKVAGYRRTICNVEARDYLLRRLNGVEEPIVAKSATARNALIEILSESIKALHWKDFETLIDIVFARSGWSRVSALGGTQKTVDMELEQATTGELAAVQVKSAASQKTLDEYVTRIDDTERFDRFFFICHSPKGELSIPSDRRDIHVWAGRDLAATILKMGLHDWVIEKVA